MIRTPVSTAATEARYRQMAATRPAARHPHGAWMFRAKATPLEALARPRALRRTWRAVRAADRALPDLLLDAYGIPRAARRPARWRVVVLLAARQVDMLDLAAAQSLFFEMAAPGSVTQPPRTRYRPGHLPDFEWASPQARERCMHHHLGNNEWESVYFTAEHGGRWAVNTRRGGRERSRVVADTPEHFFDLCGRMLGDR